jgi:hypothetical protein
MPLGTLAAQRRTFNQQYEGEGMHPTNRTARLAGLLYVLTGITGAFSLMYVPDTLIVRGNATATGNNILASEMLFRLGSVRRPDLWDRVYLAGLDSLPLTERGQPETCFADGIPGTGLRRDHVPE